MSEDVKEDLAVTESSVDGLAKETQENKACLAVLRFEFTKFKEAMTVGGWAIVETMSTSTDGAWADR